MNKSSTLKSLSGLGLGLALSYAATQQLWLHRRLRRINPADTLAAHANLGLKGFRPVGSQESADYTMTHTVEDGIERIVYLPRQRRFDTPILMQHGMWHGAWCWQPWQELFAAWGWESHAYSLPGHAGSPEQRPLRLCTIDYYLGFLKAELERLPRKPVLMGHSMGGALAQWYFKYVSGDLPAAVLVAPWVSHNALADGLPVFLKLDPLGCLLVSLTWSAAPFVRNPPRAAAALLGKQAPVSPQELYARVGPDSAMVMFQHNPPYWRPPEAVKTPILWIAAQDDTMISEAGQRRSAIHYKADFLLVEAAGHNLMMEYNYIQTAERIHSWLLKQDIP